jgi:hypothetical protein
MSVASQSLMDNVTYEDLYKRWSRTAGRLRHRPLRRQSRLGRLLGHPALGVWIY